MVHRKKAFKSYCSSGHLGPMSEVDGVFSHKNLPFMPYMATKDKDNVWDSFRQHRPATQKRVFHALC